MEIGAVGEIVHDAIAAHGGEGEASKQVIRTQWCIVETGNVSQPVIAAADCERAGLFSRRPT